MENFELPNIEDEQTVLKTIRIKLATLKKVDEISKKSNLSVNRIINECIEFALNNLDVEKLKKDK